MQLQSADLGITQHSKSSMLHFLLRCMHVTVSLLQTIGNSLLGKGEVVHEVIENTNMKLIILVNMLMEFTK